MVKIAVEHPFTDVQRALKKKGYQADMVKRTIEAIDYDAIVVRNQNVFAGSRIEGSLVETRGRSINEIVEEVEERLQRAGKIAGTANAAKSSSSGSFTSGVITGALVGAAAALLAAPKSGKELQSTVKEKISGGNSDDTGKLDQAKEKALQLTGQLKEKAMEIKDKKGSNGSSAGQQKGKTSAFATVPEGFRVVTVGSGNPLTEIGRNSPSTLVQFKDKYFLVDCGANTTSTLLELGLPAEKITNMLFTHQHVDHNGDFWTFFIDGWQGSDGRRALNLVGPQVQELYDTTVKFFKKDLEYRASLGTAKDGALTNVNITDFTEEHHSLELDGVKITAIPVPHTAPTYAYRFEAEGQSVVISGDLAYTDNLAPFAKGADILVLDGMMTGTFSALSEKAAKNLRDGLEGSHATTEELAKMAADAGAKKAVLTHIGLGGIDTEYVKKAFSDANFKGEIVPAEDGLVINP
ncbi:YkuS family protein [Planococcus shenhongbingii]|uniref:YkuS family protein n=1 Tax=Planococcus shenhongbingii TaxID=3058398 RepID=UPI00260BD84B|nr:YkuS family protein [Planococcus sp. N016]WKA59130.1 YkuS family protein [Planococcus sp. N016]